MSKHGESISKDGNSMSKEGSLMSKGVRLIPGFDRERSDEAETISNDGGWRSRWGSSILADGESGAIGGVPLKGRTGSRDTGPADVSSSDL